MLKNRPFRYIFDARKRIAEPPPHFLHTSLLFSSLIEKSFDGELGSISAPSITPSNLL